MYVAYQPLKTTKFEMKLPQQDDSVNGVYQNQRDLNAPHILKQALV